MTAGSNQITRSSQESTLTVPAQTWLQIKNNTYDPVFCGCGLPDHLILPKGSPEGTVYDLFVMLTPGDEDAVEDTNIDVPFECQAAPVWCTHYGRKYPDAKPMGYPFDRLPFSVQSGNSSRMVRNLDEYVKEIPNMQYIPVNMHMFPININHYRLYYAGKYNN